MYPPSETRRRFLRSAASLLGSSLLSRAQTSARKPNIIVILADDLGYADVGFNGCRDFRTPNIDSIAQHGIRCTSGYVSHPFCSPTRAGFLTGRYQQRFGHENNPVYDPTDEKLGLPLTETTIADVMGKAGYATIHVGKWHEGATPSHRPMRRGFQESFGFLGGGHDYFEAEDTLDTKEYKISLQRNGEPVKETEYLTDAFSREAVAAVKRHAQHPFFLYLAYNCPHTPQQVSQRYLDRYLTISDPKRRLYAAMIAAMDEGVGKLLAAVRDAGIENDTLIFFLSDNGGPINVNGSSNAPLRAGKGTVYEGGIRVPFAVQWKGHLKPGVEYHEPVIQLDILPTAAALAGAQVPKDRKIDGVDLIPYLTGAKTGAPHDRLFWRTGGGETFALREGNYKLVRNGQGTQLFDLKADIGESTNLADKQPDVLKRLDAAREQWNSELIAPIFPNPPAAAGNAKKKKKA